MSLSTFIKLTIKAFKFTVARPLQRFNIYNRAKKYLGPDARYFAPAPRAIGALSQNGGKPLQYPHLEKGFKSIKQVRSPKALSESKENDDNLLVIEKSQQLEVTKTIEKIEPPTALTEAAQENNKTRPLPKCTNLPLQDIASIWMVDKVPPGRLSLDQLQEIMLNQLGDHNYWTPKRVAEKYNIKEEYVKSLFESMKQIRIVVSPAMAKCLDIAGLNNPYYQSAKHLIYHVDNRLRSSKDKMYDEMFLPTEKWDDEVRKVLEPPKSDSLEPKLTSLESKKLKRAEPLRIQPINKKQEEEKPPRLLK